MFDKDLNKHLREFQTYVQKNQYEESPNGVFFPRAGAFIRGEFTHNVNGLDERIDSNLVVDEGIAHILDVVYHGSTPNTTWYLGIYSGNVSPTNAWTAANFAANATEITTDYSEATRPIFNEAAAAAGVTTNSANKAAFTISAASVNIYGAGLLSSNVKGGTAGVLSSAAKFSLPRTLYTTDVFNLGYSITLTSA